MPGEPNDDDLPGSLAGDAALPPPPRPLRASPSWLAVAMTRSTLHERMLFTYLVALLVGVVNAAQPGRGRAVILLVVDLVLFVGALAIARGPASPFDRARGFVQRLLVMAVILGSFFQLDILLPASRTVTRDHFLHAVDLFLFRVEPAVAWDAWVTPSRTEWFSFFYFSYFMLLAVHVLPMIFFERRRRVLSEFALGMVCVYCVGQVVYILVPAFGPYQSLVFEHRLEGGFWWSLVQSGASAIDETRRTDVFPSLHTAGPMFLTLLSFRHRKKIPFRFTWPVMAFFTSQIMLATLYLRWHYLIDVVAGVLLASGSVVAIRYSEAEERERLARGDGAIWAPFLGRSNHLLASNE